MIDATTASIVEGQGLAFHLYEEADRALRSWALVETNRRNKEAWLNGRRPVQPRGALGLAWDDAVAAALRDALMTLGRMTDPPGYEKSLFKLPKLLEAKAVDLLRVEHGGESFERAVRFLQGDKCRWNKEVKTKDWREANAKGLHGRPYTIMKCRAEYQRFRTALHAHAGDRENIGGLVLNRYRMMILLCVSAAVACLRVFCGASWNARADFRLYSGAQRELLQSTSVEYLHYSASRLERFVWE